MPSVLSFLTGAADLIIVVAAFSLIIIVHELGHFVAARWAGIRVLAFAVGFGPALVSFRKGLGWRRGSSEAEYRKRLAETFGDRTLSVGRIAGSDLEMAPTEYRLNVLPFGGYVKMLGQDDADPGASSQEPDSYQSCPPWKRMIVISAGVAANMVGAMLLFVGVFTLGLSVEPAKIGAVEPGSPAATAVAINAEALGVARPGLRPGDEVLAVDGQRPDSFNDLVLATAMSRAGQSMRTEVRRPGLIEPLQFDITPRQDEASHLLTIGVGPGLSSQIDWRTTGADTDAVRRSLDASGFGALRQGMRLTAVNGAPTTSPYAIEDAVHQSRGEPVALTFTRPEGDTTNLELRPVPALQREQFRIGESAKIDASHLLGLMPILAVRDTVPGKPAAKSGLRAGDVFVQLGSLEWPTIPAGIAEVRRNAGGSVHVAVVRKDDSGAWTEVDLGQVRVDGNGQIGFEFRDSAELGAWVGRFDVPAGGEGSLPSGARLPIPGGSRVLNIGGKPVGTLADIRDLLREAATGATPAGITLDLEIQPPIAAAQPDGRRPTQRLGWTIPAKELSEVRKLGFESPLSLAIFKPEQVLLKGDGVAGAIGKGFKETRRVMTMTYLTFARLLQGSVKVEHLKGPVGIAHVGVVLLDRGWIWLMFFMGLISVNLAVINFLPIPIADGGHMVYLVYEQITGRPPPVVVQNAAALAGLILIGAVFLLVTYHDVGNVVRSLLGG